MTQARPTTCWALPGAPTATALAADVRAGRTDPVELLERSLARIAEADGDIRAFVLVNQAGARREAEQRLSQLRAGDPLGPLHGVPIGVKDIFDVCGQLTRAGSDVPPGLPATKDAEAVRRLRSAGAVVVGRTRTHEFACGLTTQHPLHGGTHNPWDTTRVPGGSSGGSAAAVAAGMVAMALGTDTACSIRLPAAWCGLVGFKPTWGAVSLEGCLALAPSLDHGGALVRDVADARLAMEVLTSQPVAQPASLAGLRIGVNGTEPPAGVDATEVAVPLQDRLSWIYGVVMGREAVREHRAAGRWPQYADLYGADVRARYERFDQTTPEQAEEAVELHDRLRQEAAELFERIDLLLLPVAATPPSTTADPDVVHLGGQVVEVRASVLPWTVLANLCGLPACSVPTGLDEDGLPTSLQVVGPPGADARVLDAAAAYAMPLG